MDTYIKFVLRRPIMVIVLLTAITLLIGTGIPKLEFDNSAEVMMPKKDSRYIYNEEVKKIYGNIGKFILMSVAQDDIWNPGFFREPSIFVALSDYVVNGQLVSLLFCLFAVGALLVLPAVIKATNISLDESPSDAMFWKIFYIGRFFNLENK